jgi:hypothetical protein
MVHCDAGKKEGIIADCSAKGDWEREPRSRGKATTAPLEKEGRQPMRASDAKMAGHARQTLAHHCKTFGHSKVHALKVTTS